MATTRLNTAQWAEFWRCDRRSVQRWVKDGFPVDQPERMALVILGMKRPADGPRSKAEEVKLAALRSEADGAPARTEEEAGGDDPKNRVSSTAPTDAEVAGAHVDLHTLLRRAYLAAAQAMRTNDQASIRFWNKEFIAIQKAIRDEEAHAKKMGLETGEVLPKADVCRLVRALAFWMVQSVDMDLKQVCPHLLNLSYVEEAWDVLDRYLLRTRFLAAFTKSVTCPSGVELPPWLVDELRDTVDDYYEPGDDGEAKDFAAFMTALEGKRAAAEAARRPAEASPVPPSPGDPAEDEP